MNILISNKKAAIGCLFYDCNNYFLIFVFSNCRSIASNDRSTASSNVSAVLEAKNSSSCGIVILIAASLFIEVSGFTTFSVTSAFVMASLCRASRLTFLMMKSSRRSVASKWIDLMFTSMISSFFVRTWMREFVIIFQFTICYMRVYLCCCQRLVAQQLLYAEQVGPVV